MVLIRGGQPVLHTVRHVRPDAGCREDGRSETSATRRDATTVGGRLPARHPAQPCLDGLVHLRLQRTLHPTSVRRVARRRRDFPLPAGREGNDYSRVTRRRRAPTATADARRGCDAARSRPTRRSAPPARAPHSLPPRTRWPATAVASTKLPAAMSTPTHTAARWTRPATRAIAIVATYDGCGRRSVDHSMSANETTAASIPITPGVCPRSGTAMMSVSVAMLSAPSPKTASAKKLMVASTTARTGRNPRGLGSAGVRHGGVRDYLDSVGPASRVRSYSRCASAFSSVLRAPLRATQAPNQMVSSRANTKAAIASGASSCSPTRSSP